MNFEDYKIKLFLLNGPPLVGKDTLADGLVSVLTNNVSKFDYSFSKIKFAAPIKRAVCSCFHAGDEEEFKQYDSPEVKDYPHDIYFGKTTREVQISVSEGWLKPMYGKRVFGDLLVPTIRQSLDTLPAYGKHLINVFFASDSGFREEAEPLVELLGPDNVFLFRLHRKDHAFGNDSRSYIYLADLGVQEYDLVNITGQKQQFIKNGLAMLKNALWGI